MKNLRVAEAKFQSIREKICQKTQVILAPEVRFPQPGSL